jgi:hypothetical protein
VTAAAAAAFCLAGAEVALLISRCFRDPRTAWQGSLAGMAPRMGIPIVLGLAFQLQRGMLAECGLLVYLIVFYPVALWMETLLCLPVGSRVGRPRGASRNVVP